MQATYDVRVYKTEVYRGSRVTTYRVRWKAGDKTWKRPFRTAAQADVFRAELLAAARKGEAFSLATGEPVYWQRNRPGATWYEFACAYVDSKWESASAPGQFGKRIVEALTGQELPDHWARTMTNTVHWATGIGFGAQFGLLCGLSERRQLALSLALGPTAWLTGYVILPLARVYKPIWDYDAVTLAKDLGTHVVYGSVTAACFAGLARTHRTS